MRYTLSAILVLILCYADVGAQIRGPEQAAVSFYRWYIGELNAGRFPVDMNRKVLLVKISDRLGKWLYSGEYEYDGTDFFLDAEDWEDTWVNNITAEKTLGYADRAEVKVTLRPSKRAKSELGMHVLHVRMIREGGRWKIDRVENRKLI